jgi:autotransporter-associated beta strand protein
MCPSLRKLLLLVCFLAVTGPLPAQSIWNNPSGGDWLVSGNWTVGVPNAPGASATFPGVVAAPISVTQSANVTVGSITFDAITSASTAYVIGSSGQTIVLNNNGAGAQITVTAGVTSTATQQFAAVGAINIADAGGLTVTHNGAGPLAINSVLAGSLPLNKNGPGTLILSGANSSLSGTVNVNGGTLQMANAAALGGPLSSTTVNVANGATFFVNNNDFYQPNYTLNIQGTGTNGRGALQFTGFSPVYWDGSVNLQADTTIQVADTFFYGGINTNGHQLTFINSSATAGINTNGISGSGGSVVVNLGSDNIGFNAASTYTGTTLIHSGTIFLTNATGLGPALGTPANGVTIDSGGQLTMNTNSLAVGNKLLSLNGGIVIGNGGAKSWAGAINLTSDSTVRAEGSAGTFTLTGGVDNGGHQLTLSTTFADSTIIVQSAGISGAGGLVKTGPGVAQVNANSGFTGPVTFTAGGTPTSGGTLQVNASFTGSPAVLVNNAGTLAGTGTVTGAVTVNGTGTIAPGQVGPGTLTVGPSTWARTAGGTARYAWKVNNWTGTTAGTDFSQLLSIGPLALTTVNPTDMFTVQVVGLTAANAAGAVPNFNAAISRTWTITTFTNDLVTAGYTPGMFRIDSTSFAANNNLGGGSFSLSLSGPSVILRFTPVPEPGFVLAVCAAAMAAVLWRRRSRTTGLVGEAGR